MNDPLRRFPQVWLSWTILWVLLLVLLFLLSEGEPVCEGPLILGADDSDPPQCDGPIAGLPVVGIMLYIFGVTASTVVAGGWALLDLRRSKHAGIGS